jgi:hypothetical protein
VSVKKRDAENDLQKLVELKSSTKNEIRQFVITSAALTGNSFSTENNVVFYVAPTAIKFDSALFLFVDGKCMGVGTIGKGLCSGFARNQFVAGHHNIMITNFLGEDLFESMVDFSIRNKFDFTQRKPGIMSLN